jgi:hypothetical protein
MALHRLPPLQQMAHWAFVFVRSGSTWTQQGGPLIPNDLASNSRLTFNVALEGNTAVLGTNFGVYVFDRTGSTWQQTQKITPPVAGGVFATSLVLRGSSLLIGDTGVVGGPGHLYLYVKSNGFGSWVRRSRLENSSNQTALERPWGSFKIQWSSARRRSACSARQSVWSVEASMPTRARFDVSFRSSSIRYERASSALGELTGAREG